MIQRKFSRESSKRTDMHNIFRLLFRNPFFFLFCFFIPFDNTSLQNIGGIMTASPSALILLPGIFITILKKGLKANKNILLCFFGVLLVSFVYYFYWVFYFSELDPVFILDRGSRYFLLYVFYFLALYYSLQQSVNDIRAGAFLIIVVVFLSVLLNFVFNSSISVAIEIISKAYSHALFPIYKPLYIIYLLVFYEVIFNVCQIEIKKCLN